MYDGGLDDPRLRAAIRLALRAHGFSISRIELDAAATSRWQLGCWLRDQTLPERFPPFVHVSDYRGIAEEDPHLWGYLPHMFAFGYEQAVVLHGLAPVSPEVDAAVAMLGAAFSAGIALLDYLVDEHAQGAILFEALNRDMVRRIFEPGDEQDAAFARTYEQFTDPRLRLLIALITTCRAGLHDLHRLSGNDVAWVGLAEMINQLYEAERIVSSATTSREEIRSLLPALETKSVLPFVVMQQISALATSQPKDPARGRHASATLGRIVWLVDDLVDLLADYRRNAPNAAVLRLADLLAEGGHAMASDADIYDVVDATVTELVALLPPDAFEIRPTTNDQRPTTDFIHQTHGKAVTGHSSESLRNSEVYRIPVERDEGKADLVTVLDFARLTV
ncbi:MAG: hypothetical protein M3380_18810, partial [Chloroflexota bacterium]|nr:hypothetical protein [Chloroflexota bacterium]